jgi:hypothetical protein
MTLRAEQWQFRRLIRNKRRLDGVIAQLRHAYMQLAAGTVRDQKRFADGLIAPQIRELERFAGNGDGESQMRPEEMK